jgi:RHS repeat-associated protein
MTYNAVGDVASVTDPNGNVTTSTYDAARRPTTVTSPATPAAPKGVVTALSYDPDGRVVQTQQSASGVVLRTASATYTPTGKPATATDANGNMTRYGYDALDRLSKVTDAERRITSYGYDTLSRRTAVLNAAIQAAPLLQQGYSPNGALASLIDANGNATGFAYDGFDRLATTTYPGGGTETFSYDADGNVLSRKTRANATIAFAYDTLNRLVTKTPPAPAPVVSYSYDLAGRLTGVSDTGAAITAAVPPAPNTKYTTSYAYDALNRPTSVGWDPAPAVATPASTIAVTFSHTYNRTNQRSGQSSTDNSWWLYPAATPGTVGYTANALNQYTAVGAVTPTYDTNGNLTSDGTFTYGYDAENRLASASGAGNTASYDYDGQGRRKLKTVNGTTTVFVTDADNREVLEYDGASGATLRWYAYGLGSNAVLNQMNVVASTRATVIPDIQGSIIGTLDSSSGTLTKVGYSPYGASASASGPFGYTSQRRDTETAGLYYYRARMYAPTWGRFMQTDPIGYSGGSRAMGQSW